MKYKVLKGCVLESEKRKVGEVIELTEESDIRIGLAYKQIQEHKTTTKTVKKAVKKAVNKTEK